MNCKARQNPNPIERFVACFDSVGKAAEAAKVSTEMLRKMRHRGYVSTRDRALVMAGACRNRVKPAALLALPGSEGRAR